MIVLSDYRAEILDLTVNGATREGCMTQADALALQYFGTQEPLKRYVCSIEIGSLTYDMRVALWTMHIYYRRVVDCQSPFERCDKDNCADLEVA